MQRVIVAALLLLAAAPAARAGYDEALAAAKRGDAVAAMRELQPLADKGDARALKLLASLYHDGGNGLVRDPMRAMQLYRRAAEAGDAEAQYALGKGYVTGALRSPNQAYYWLSVAVENASPANRETWRRDRDSAGSELTAGELEQARDAAMRFLGREPSAAPARVEPKPPIALVPSPSNRPVQIPAKPPTTGKRTAGSGFVVGNDGKIVTNAHVVPACRSIRVTFGDGVRRDATLVARDDKNDLALLGTPVTNAETIRFREGKPVRAGEGVVVVGYPLSSVLSREANVTVGVVSALAGRKGDNRFFQITAPVQKGNSGGPLADMSGNVIGIVATKLDAMKIAERTGDLPQNVNFAIKADVARKFLADNGIGYRTAAPVADLSAADVGEMIKRVTVFVECDG